MNGIYVFIIFSLIGVMGVVINGVDFIANHSVEAKMMMANYAALTLASGVGIGICSLIINRS